MVMKFISEQMIVNFITPLRGNKKEIVMSKKYTWKDIRSKLSKCSERDLIGLIGDLYKLNKDNKNFLNTMFYNDESAITQYQEVISKSLIFE